MPGWRFNNNSHPCWINGERRSSPSWLRLTLGCMWNIHGLSEERAYPIINGNYSVNNSICVSRCHDKMWRPITTSAHSQLLRKHCTSISSCPSLIWWKKYHIHFKCWRMWKWITEKNRKNRKPHLTWLHDIILLVPKQMELNQEELK